MATPCRIRGEYITLGQFLKLVDYISSGAEAKMALADDGFLVNGEAENRRGRKLRDGDLVRLPNGNEYRIAAS